MWESDEEKEKKENEEIDLVQPKEDNAITFSARNPIEPSLEMNIHFGNSLDNLQQNQDKGRENKCIFQHRSVVI